MPVSYTHLDVYKRQAQKVPYLGTALLVFDTFRAYGNLMDRIHLDSYETVMNQGHGVIAVQWQLEGRASGTGTNYFPWDGSTSYGCYPYATP